MKPMTSLILNKELNEHRGEFYLFDECEHPYNLQRLFDIYAENEIKTIDNLFASRKDFSQFIFQNAEHFVDIDNNDINSLRNIVHRLLASFLEFNCGTISKDNRFGQERFAYMVEDFIKRNKKLPILDVGSGRVPYSSIILGTDGYDVTTMDETVLSEPCLKNNFNVKSNRRYFKTGEAIGEYGIVVGRRPCSAISRIVECGAQQKKPYFIKLCGCDAPGQDNSGWAKVLPKLDKNSTIFRDFIFNMNGLTDENGGRITNDDVSQTIIDFNDYTYEK